MILWFTIVQLVVAVVVGAVALILGLAGRRPSDLTVGGMALVLVLLLAQTFWIVPAAELTPSLQNSHWIYIHIGVAIMATALSILGAVVASLSVAMYVDDVEVDGAQRRVLFLVPPALVLLALLGGLPVDLEPPLLAGQWRELRLVGRGAHIRLP